MVGVGGMRYGVGIVAGSQMKSQDGLVGCWGLMMGHYPTCGESRHGEWEVFHGVQGYNFQVQR